MAHCNLLLVEDDTSLADWITAYLISHQFNVTHAKDGQQAIELIQQTQPDIVLLDVMLPHKNGFEVCQAVRPTFLNPILMLTACNEEADEIKGLELGATDFIGKPVRPKILLARINALLRRPKTAIAANSAQPNIHNNILAFDDLRLDAQDKSVYLAKKSIAITANEFDLLWCLATHAGEIVSREVLLKTRRGIDYDGFDRSIDIAVSRLRKKLNDTHTPPEKIKTIRAKGYLFSATAWQIKLPDSTLN